MTRFRLDDLVELGDGWARLPVPGEELFRVRAFGLPYRWMPEDALLAVLARLDRIQAGLELESMVVPGVDQTRLDMLLPDGTFVGDPDQLVLPPAEPARCTFADPGACVSCNDVPPEECRMHRDQLVLPLGGEP